MALTFGNISDDDADEEDDGIQPTVAQREGDDGEEKPDT